MIRRPRPLAFFLAVMVLAAAPAVRARADKSAPEAFGPGAVFDLPMDPLMECLAKNQDSSTCVIQVMKKGKASREALAFAAKIEGEGCMKAFKKVGKVSLATVEFPMRANTNQALMMVGGAPSVVSTELEANAIDITKDKAFAAIKRRFPQIELWGVSAELRATKSLPGGGQSFEFAYPLLNGCHACELGGYALVAFDFGPDGTFQGQRLIRLEAAR
jgi:hypothetical protein